jgi:hypothetical protein
VKESTITVGSTWGETSASAGLRLVRVLSVDDFKGGFVVVETARESDGRAPRTQRTSRIRIAGFLQRYRPVEAR